MVALWVLLCVGPGTPLIDESAPPEARLNPLFQSLVAGFFIIFLAAGWAYGAAAGTVKNHRELIAMMQGAMSDMAYYLVLSFAAAHFVAMFNWSNLGLIFAIHGAAALESANMPDTLLMAAIILFGAVLNLFIGSASAKWALLAPVLVPMLMLVEISPEMEHRGVSRRRQRHQYHHAADALFPAGAGVRATLAKGIRPWQPGGDDVALLGVPAARGIGADYSLGVPWPAAGSGRARFVHHALSKCYARGLTQKRFKHEKFTDRFRPVVRLGYAGFRPRPGNRVSGRIR